MRILALLLLVVVAGCSEEADRPAAVVRDYLEARDSVSCRYLTATQAVRCRRPRAPEPPANGVVIDAVRIGDDEATIRASYEWAGYRRHSTFALVRRDDAWLIAREIPD
jgi:hypothetical protein